MDAVRFRPRARRKHARRYNEDVARWDKAFTQATEHILREDNEVVYRTVAEHLLQSSTDNGIRTAILISGEQAASTHRLLRHVEDALGTNVVVLRPQDCTTVRLAMRTLSQAIAQRGRPLQGRMSELALIRRWARLQQAAERPRIVITVTNAESVPGAVLEHVVQALTALDTVLDPRLLLNVATSFNDLRGLLTTSTCELLCARLFRLESSEVSIERIVTDVLLATDDRLCFGFEIFDAILGDYKTAHRAADLFLRSLRYAALCHFGSTAYDECEVIRSLLSMRKLVEQTHDVRMLTDDVYLRAKLDGMRSEILQYRRDVHKAFIMLSSLKECLLPHSSYRRYDLYRLLLAGRLRGHNLLGELRVRLRVARPEVIRGWLATSALSEAASLMVELDNIMGMADDSGTESRPLELRKLDSFYRANDTKLGLAPRISSPRTEHELRASRTTRASSTSSKAVAEALRGSLTLKQQRWTALVDRLDVLLHKYFQDKLINHEHLPLHELYWFDQSCLHTASFAVDVRSGLGKALSFTALPIVKAFSLFQDSGQLINVYDWCRAFSEDDDSPLSQALFMRALTEMRFMGLLKATRRKTDHVQKCVTVV
ncbi:Origin recognition complex subunit 3 [Savitreella phatthalungensis]